VLIFKVGDEEVGERWCYFRSHGCTRNLEAILVVELKVIQIQNHVQKKMSACCNLKKEHPDAGKSLLRHS
jgi:hypothetical protein